MKRSKLFSINTLDIIKGILVAVGVGVLTAITALSTSPEFFTIVTLKTAGASGISTLAVYLLKNFLTDEKGAIKGLPIDTTVTE